VVAAFQEIRGEPTVYVVVNLILVFTQLLVLKLNDTGEYSQ